MIYYPDSNRVGFQESHRTGAKVTIYSRTPGAGPSSTTLKPFALYDRTDLLLTQLSTQNVLGQGGSFQISFRCEPGFDPLLYVDTDAWADISFVQDNVEHHIMRGTIDEIRHNQSATGQGTTVSVCNITGSSFQKCYATTPLWFNRNALENIGNGILFDKFGIDSITGSPATNVSFILLGLFQLIGDAGRSNFSMPFIMPNVKKGKDIKGNARLKPTLDASVNINTDYFDQTFMPRICPTANQLFPDTDLWTMAMAFADLQWEELFTDIYPQGGYAAYRASPDAEDGSTPSNSEMTIMFRDKPFPVVTPDAGPPQQLGAASRYFTDLPLHKCRRGEIQDISIGISSLESFNAFMSTDGIFGNGGMFDFTANYPLWSPVDMERRGMRRMGGSSMYSPTFDKENNNGVLVTQMRAKLRDWYCLGAEYRQGSISFARPKLTLRVGSRIEISGPGDRDLVTYYIEGVRHNYSAQGIKTQIDVTRGYKGSITDHLNRLNGVINDYSLGLGLASTLAPVKV